jgi:hypothetical protein
VFAQEETDESQGQPEADREREGDNGHLLSYPVPTPPGSALFARVCAFIAQVAPAVRKRCAELVNFCGAPPPEAWHIPTMDEQLLERLRGRRAAIRQEWETLLRTEPVATPLGHPDTLAYLIHRTLNDVFAALGAPNCRRRPGRPRSYAAIRAACGCGRNPLLAYFLAGERALLEALILAQSEIPGLPPEKRDKAVTELYLVLRGFGQREVESFCSVCQHRPRVAAALLPADLPQP